MAFYRQLGVIPPKRHTQHRDENGDLYYEELMGEEGFSSDSALLYHRYIPSRSSTHRVEAARSDHHAESPAQAAAPEAARSVPRDDLGRDGCRDRSSSGPGQRRRAHLVRRVVQAFAAVPQRRRRRDGLRRVR